MSQRLHHEAFFQRPRAEVFDWITTMGHWPLWHPATQSVSGQTALPGRVGDEAEEKMLTAGYFPGHIRWRVVASTPPQRWRIVTTEIDVPLLSRASVWLEYELREEDHGTRLLRTFCYQLPVRLWLFDLLYFRSKMESESVEGLRRLTALVDEQQAVAA